MPSFTLPVSLALSLQVRMLVTISLCRFFDSQDRGLFLEGCYVIGQGTLPDITSTKAISIQKAYFHLAGAGIK